MMTKINILEEHAIAAKETILVVPDAVVNNFEGFKSSSGDEIVELINKHGRYEYRNEDLELNESLRQIIPYVLVCHKDLNNQYMYAGAQRTSKTGDQRLVGEVFIGFGGHVGALDIEDKDFYEWQKREIDEEIEYKGNILKQEFLGLIRATNPQVSRVHLALVFRIELESNLIRHKEDKMENLQWYSINNLTKLVEDKNIEGWSREIILSNIL